MVEITLRLEGRELLMQSCSRCDLRLWRDEGEDIELTAVLGRDPARQPALR